MASISRIGRSSAEEFWSLHTTPRTTWEPLPTQGQAACGHALILPRQHTCSVSSASRELFDQSWYCDTIYYCHADRLPCSNELQVIWKKQCFSWALDRMLLFGVFSCPENQKIRDSSPQNRGSMARPLAPKVSLVQAYGPLYISPRRSSYVVRPNVPLPPNCAFHSSAVG